MLIKDLKPRNPVKEIELSVTSKEEAREFTSRYGVTGRVCNAIATDDSGEEIQLTLWNDEIEKVPIDSKIRVTDGWVKEWNGKLQLSAGKYGKLDILE